MSHNGASRIAVAAVTYPAPHGIEAVELFEGEIVAFGRGSECKIRFGFAPQPDQGLPRVVGKFLTLNQRVFIESSNQLGHRAIEVQTPQKSVQIAIGEGYGPSEPHFDVIARGSIGIWRLNISLRNSKTVRMLEDAVDLPTMRPNVELSELQTRVLNAYCEPLRCGRIEPASHRDVGLSLNYSASRVRQVLYEVWSIFFEQGIPMVDVDDKRVAVVEAARVHGLSSR